MAKEKLIEVPAPRENPHLFGHAQAVAQFLSEAERGQLHHAYLITGPKGIGKATLAYSLARNILSRGALQAKQEEAPSLSLFGDAPALFETPTPHPEPLAIAPDSPLFRRIAGGTHTDLLTVSPAYDVKKHVEKDIISVDEARKVPEFLSLTPAEGDWRVVIVDAVDQLNTGAANALLKIVEEPPARALLFLICHQPGAILPTIRSRCRRLVLRPADRAVFEQVLSTVAPAVPAGEYAALYALSGGAPGLAITLYATGGMACYRQWLEAMQPDAGFAQRQRVAESFAAQKSPDAWRTVLHGWHLAISRICRWPHVARDEWVLHDEGALLESISSALLPVQRDRWQEKAERLLADNETFHLDKRQSLMMLMRPAVLDSLAA